MNEQAQAAVKWIGEALTDYAGTLPPSARPAFVAYANAQLRTLQAAATAVQAEQETVKPETTKRGPGRPPRTRDATQPPHPTDAAAAPIDATAG